MNERFLNKITLGDATVLLTELDSDSIDIVLTDPPYFLDKMDNNWDHETVSSNKYQHAVKSLPPGMKFDREQGKRFYSWYLEIAHEILRILKPGGFFFSFSSPRLYHRLVSAVDDAGFLIRDCFIWLYTQNQPKAMSLNHFIRKMNSDIETKENLKNKLMGWKTPQIKSCFEPIMMAQKKCEGTFLNNMIKHEVGLLNTNAKIGQEQDMFPANVMTTETIDRAINKYFLVSKPSKNEKGKFNNHRTVKPLAICEYLIKLAAFADDAIILDPFIGSGTTAVAAKKLGKRFIGIDCNEEYVEIARKRLEELSSSTDREERKGKEQVLQPMLFNV